ncbi:MULTISPECIES: ABC transporter ATP-binding protein [unclassified Paenibacillus]|jgi:peptide/nickel transport system ATP-binding protein|uniref:ABC transporter ATP-binding protein n=1 Tax=unclassified Paenibacillus TaxID=185978 RepID=UPI00040C29BC|nr:MULTISPECIES: ABC transporter ATP-binding protein [unclassified Paenibacillus]KGP81405.1 peptide ABC transporter ATPase [Paenibacillus sp. MAEPY2]KGP87090.1 peptide ABC transporter ATPase [Paenibacillus sp. MAEPY1]
MATQAVHKEQPLLSVQDLKIRIQMENGVMNAVDGVDFNIYKGKTLGLVGESGCGKSLTSRSIISINPKECETSGTITYNSDSEMALHGLNLLSLKPTGKQIRSIRGRKISMIFQEPMTAFSPMYTIGNQIMEAIRIHQTKNKKEAKKIALEMLSKVGISDQAKRFDQYPHEFSGGMRQRAMISMALSCNPEILIADEPTTALDVTIQAQVLELMKSLQAEFGMAILLVTHDLGIIAEMCDEVAVMYLGRIVEQAPMREIFNNPKHPYTKGLLKSMPRLGGNKSKRLDSIEGSVPMPINMPPMCGFYDRCKDRIEGVCNRQAVPKTAISDQHMVRCFLYADQREGEAQ